MMLHYLGSGVGPGFCIPCLLQNTSHIHWLHLPKQSFKKKQKILKKDETPNKSYCIGLPTQNSGLRLVGLEPSPKRGSDKINKLRLTTKNTTQNKRSHIVQPGLINKNPGLREVDLEPSAKIENDRTSILGFFWHGLEHVKLVLDDNMDEESK